MALQDLIKTIAEGSGLSEEEVASQVNKKRDELGGLITHEGAAYIIAREFGLNLFKGEPRNHDLKVENVIAGMSRVDIVGKVVKVYPIREFNKKDGTPGVMGSIILGDETGVIRVAFWDKSASLIAEGKIMEDAIVRIKNGYSKANQNGEAEIHIRNTSRITVKPGDLDPADMKPAGKLVKISELRGEMSRVDVLCKVMRVYEAREFEREGEKKGRVANLLAADETGEIRIVLWDEAVGLLDKGLIKVGDTIRVEKGYVKMRNMELEINVGRFGKVILNPPEGVLSAVVQGPVVAKRDLSGLKDGDNAMIRGALVELYGRKVFERKDGSKGLVVNAAIDDGTACLRAAFYGRQAEALLDLKLAGGDIEGAVDKAVEEKKNKILGRELLATVDVRHNDFSGQDELVVQEMITNPDPKEIIKELLEETKTVEG